MASLYCFLAAEGLIFLKRGYLPFCSPNQLADPWMQPNVLYQKQNTPVLAADDFRQHLQQQYDQLPENLRSMVSFGYFVQQSQVKREQIEESLAASKQLQEVPSFNSESVKNWRILDLYAGWKDARLWQQFGASGQGLVLELSASSSFLKAASYNEQAQHFSAISQVEYWQPEDDLYYFFNRPFETIESTTGLAQWRLLRQLESADRQISVKDSTRAMFRLPYKAIKRVILGYGCSPEYCQQVKSYLSQDIHYRHVDCVQAQINPKTMKLETT